MSKERKHKIMFHQFHWRRSIFNAKGFLAVWLVNQEFVSRAEGDTMVSFYQLQDLGIIKADSSLYFAEFTTRNEFTVCC